MTKRALVIGIPGNPSFPRIPNLDAVYSQASDVERQFRLRGFQVTSLIGNAASASVIEDAMRKLYSESFVEDTTLLYYLGHGFYRNNVLWLTTSQASFEQAIREHHLIDISTRLQGLLKDYAAAARKNYIIIDCCDSGLIKLLPDNPAPPPPWFCCITSTNCIGGIPQEAIADHGDKKELLFTHKFLACLRQGKAWSMEALYDSLYTEIPIEASRQNRTQQPYCIRSSNFGNLYQETLFEATELTAEFERIQTFFFANACTNLKSSYFFPYAYLLSLEDDYEQSSTLNTLYKKAKDQKVDSEQLRIEITRWLNFFQHYERLCLENEIDANVYKEQYLADEGQYLAKSYKVKLSHIFESISLRLKRFREKANDDTQKRFAEIAKSSYDIYKEEYFINTRKYNTKLPQHQIQKLTNDCLGIIRHEFFPIGANLWQGNQEKTEAELEVPPFVFITRTQTLVEILYECADDIVKGIRDRESVVKDRKFLSQSSNFGVVTCNRDTEDKSQKKWIEELDWAIEKLALPKPIIEIESETRKDPVPPVPEPKDSNKPSISPWWLSLGLLIIAMGATAANFIPRGSQATIHQPISWCDKEISNDLVKEIIEQNKLNCKDVSSLKSIRLDGQGIDDTKLDNLINLLKDSKLDEIDELDLSENNIEKLEKIEKLGELKIKKLYLSRNSIKNIDIFLNNRSNLMESLKVIWLDNNAIENIPETINSLKNLEELRISNNPLLSADDSIERILRLPKIQKLWAETLGASEKIWSSINNKETLRSLYLAKNNIKNITKIDLPYLQELDLSENGLGSNKFDLSNVRNLKKLKLGFNRLQDVDINLNCEIEKEQLNLREIDLSSNNLGGDVDGNPDEDKLIKAISDHSKCFPYLRTLILNENKIKSIKGIDKIKSITYLKVSANQLSNINGVEGLESLKELILFDNKLKYNSQLIDSLKSLSEKSKGLLILDLSRNDLSLSSDNDTPFSKWDEMRYALSEFKKIKKISLSGNRGVTSDIEKACPDTKEAKKCDF
ncbi:caspase family protein [Pseudanabaena sp. FACHB-1277]|uniref:Caspase family protein n=1 Tax=Pseudanabaena cinerea FACHB-1277 TaxID=2949581 RepID=A0A926UXI7_9CYAN|nr:caspase family protein [Pseudanabaena cinerea]MBD2152678.1 caspase family protein [Pseudanabaena cinerea FACHB-1277]